MSDETKDAEIRIRVARHAKPTVGALNFRRAVRVFNSVMFAAF